VRPLECLLVAANLLACVALAVPLPGGSSRHRPGARAHQARRRGLTRRPLHRVAAAQLLSASGRGDGAWSGGLNEVAARQLGG